MLQIYFFFLYIVQLKIKNLMAPPWDFLFKKVVILMGDQEFKIYRIWKYDSLFTFIKANIKVPEICTL